MYRYTKSNGSGEERIFVGVQAWVSKAGYEKEKATPLDDISRKWGDTSTLA